MGTIYGSGTAMTTPIAGSYDNYYAYISDVVLAEREIVMSQSDSDYRDENCEQRTFRANLRQVGSGVTNCGPGQLPDTDSKRCTWNWNYNPHTAYVDDGEPQWDSPAAFASQINGDAEGWFDRNNPHNFDTWSTRKRRAASNDRKYVFNSDRDNAAITIPITPFEFRLKFQAYNTNVVVEAPVVQSNDAECFKDGAANPCVCKPTYTEINAVYNFVDGTNAASTYAGGAINTLYSAICADDGDELVIDAVGQGVYLCDGVDDTAVQNALDDEPDCYAFKTASEAQGFIFADGEENQQLIFDDSRITAMWDPIEGEWFATLACTADSIKSMS